MSGPRRPSRAGLSAGGDVAVGGAAGAAPGRGERAATWVAAASSAVCLVAWGLYLSGFAVNLPDPGQSRGGPRPQTFSSLFIALAGLIAAWLALTYSRRALLLPHDPDRARGRPTRVVTACWSALVATVVALWRPDAWVAMAAVAGLVWAASSIVIARAGRRS